MTTLRGTRAEHEDLLTAIAVYAPGVLNGELSQIIAQDFGDNLARALTMEAIRRTDAGTPASPRLTAAAVVDQGHFSATEVEERLHRIDADWDPMGMPEGCLKAWANDAIRDFADRRSTVDLAKVLDKCKAMMGKPGCTSADILPELKKLFSTAPSSKEQQLSTTRISDVEIERVLWLWKSRLPMGLSIIAGHPGVGKTTLGLDVLSRISRGTPWPDGSGSPDVGSVILMTQEDSISQTIAPRLTAMGADLDRIHVVNFTERTDHSGQRTFSLDRDLDLLDDLVVKLGDVRAIFVDPINAYLGGDRDSYKDPEVRAALNPLNLLATRHRIAVVSLMHFRKATSDHAMFRVLGSVAFTAMARAVWAVVEDDADKEQRLMLPVKMNLCRKPPGLRFQIVSRGIPGFDGDDPSIVEWLGDSTMDIDEAMAPTEYTKPGPKAEKLDEAMVWLKGRFPLGINLMAATDLRLAALKDDINYKTLQRARDELGLSQWKSKEFGAATMWGWEKP